MSLELIPILNPTVLMLVLIGSIGLLCLLGWVLRQDRKRLNHTVERVQSSALDLLGKIPPNEDDPHWQIQQTLASLTAAFHTSQNEIADHNHHLRVLYTISEQLSQENSLTGAINVAVESIWQAANVDFVAMALGEDELGPFRYVGLRGVDNPLALLGQECNLPLWGVLAQALVNHPQNGEPDYLIIQDIAAEARPDPSEFPWAVRAGSLMIIPMRHGAKTSGAILIGSRTPHYLGSGARSTYLYTIAKIITIAVQEAQTRQQSNRWVQQLLSLQAFTRTIIRTHKAGNVLTLLNDELIDLFGDVEIRIFLVGIQTGAGAEALAVPPLNPDQRKGETSLQIYAAHPLTEEERQTLWSPEVMKLVRWVLAAEQPLFFNPADPLGENDDLYYRVNGRGVLIPIGEEKTIGAIYISAPNRVSPFEESDLIVMRTIANSAAIAFDNIHLYQRLNQQVAVERPLPD